MGKFVDKLKRISPDLKQMKLNWLKTPFKAQSAKHAQKLPFTNEQQPSLATTILRAAARQKRKDLTRHLPASRVNASSSIITKLKKKTNFKIGVALKVRGVVWFQELP